MRRGRGRCGARSRRDSLDDRTGIAAFRQLVAEHFGARAGLIMRHCAFGRV